LRQEHEQNRAADDHPELGRVTHRFDPLLAPLRFEDDAWDILGTVPSSRRV
jgi:hypothetical protein